MVILSKSLSPAFVRRCHSPSRRHHSPSPTFSNRFVSVSSVSFVSVSNRLVCLRLQPSRLSPSPTVSFVSVSLRSSGWTMNLEDTNYMSGDELMDQNSDEDEAVAVEDTLMSTAENRRKRGDSFKEINLERMDNEDTMNLEDTDYMSGDELMDQNPDEDEAVAVEDTLMSTSENRRKKRR
ncbi:hypothetical protein F2Q69_00002733 [Brassica cretica]|uniref:Uncharacterized protein n=1 Tax=Brassica cretica TaxID=69181 RepID=A0A8S9NYN0_BRACR|nr:hypothetical protein F2Q69_00002733 [Brassica cretica]